MLPPGLSFNAISAKALEAARHARMPRSYWDWADMLGPNANGFFVGDYQGLIEADGVLVAFYGKANDGDTLNRTDIVAAPMPYLPPIAVATAE